MLYWIKKQLFQRWIDLLTNSFRYTTISTFMPVCPFTIRLSQISTFLSNWKNHVDHNFFPFFRSKALQKTKFWKFSYIFSTGPSLPKFYYITHLCEIELTRKFHFLKIFHFKTMHLFPKSKLYIKNLFFWGVLCWSSSNDKRKGGEPMRRNLQRHPPPILLSFEVCKQNVPQKNQFLM